MFVRDVGNSKLVEVEPLHKPEGPREAHRQHGKGDVHHSLARRQRASICKARQPNRTRFIRSNWRQAKVFGQFFLDTALVEASNDVSAGNPGFAAIFELDFRKRLGGADLGARRVLEKSVGVPAV